ncbi:MAG: hypothetical protein IJ435_02920 [Clostridia bacterium]|nr:hypothetical protein [Clostridia bacterium]
MSYIVFEGYISNNDQSLEIRKYGTETINLNTECLDDNSKVLLFTNDSDNCLFQDDKESIALTKSNYAFVSVDKNLRVNFIKMFLDSLGHEFNYSVENFAREVEHGNYALVKYYFHIAEMLEAHLRIFCSNNDINVLSSVEGGDFLVFSISKNDENALNIAQFMLNALIEDTSSQYTAMVQKNKECIEVARSNLLKREYWVCISNYNSYRYKDLYNQILNTKTVSIYEDAAYTLFYYMIKRRELDVSNLRWMSASGELYPDLPERLEFFDIKDDVFFKLANKFIKNTGSDSLLRCWSWMYYFYFYSVFETVCPYDKNDWRYKYFWGIYPVLETENGAPVINSEGYSEISPYYNIDFLKIKSNQFRGFWDLYPPLIHEFFHYVPAYNRKARNRLILVLLGYYLFKPLLTISSSKGNVDTKNKYKKAVSEFLEKHQQFEQYVHNDNSETLYYDSRYLYAIIQKQHTNIDFEVAFDQIINNVYGNEGYFGIELAKSACIKRWDRYYIPAVRVFLRLFKELRSDLAMCTILNFTVSDYIHCILKDKYLCAQLVTNAEKLTAISNIARISMVIRFLSGNFNTINNSWINEIQKIVDLFTEFDSIKKENLIDYLKYYDDKYLNGKENISFLESVCNELIEVWVDEFEGYCKNVPLLRNAEKLYKRNLQLYGTEKMLFQIENCLYFKDCYYFEQN